jgi:hypothetical protein
MKFLVWMLGVMVIYLGMETTAAAAPRWWWVWIASAVLWFFAGCGLALSGVAKLVSGKVGAGGWAGVRAKAPAQPAPHKEV